MMPVEVVRALDFFAKGPPAGFLVFFSLAGAGVGVSDRGWTAKPVRRRTRGPFGEWVVDAGARAETLAGAGADCPGG